MPLATVHELADRRSCRLAYEAALAGGPVRYVPRAFVEALQGAWGELPVSTSATPVLPLQRAATT